MMRRQRVRWVMGGCLLAVLGCAGGGSPPADDRGPVLLITVDGLIAADLEPFGGTQPMPGLQRLADQGTVWPRALSAVPMTRPAVATYLTGVAPDRHGVRDDLFAVLPAEIPTLAERLTAAGYRTAGFPDSSFLPERSGLWRGFELVDRPPAVAISASRWLPRVRPTRLTLEAFSAWLDSLEDGTDWFGWIHLSHPLVGQLKQQYVSVPGSAQADDLAAYEESLAEFDTLLGQILDRIDARADGSETLILLAGTLGDQRRDESPTLPGSGYSLARRAVEVPVIARFPAGVEARAAHEGVWALDLAATVAAWTGVELSAAAEGVSLTEPAPERTIFSWSWALLDQMGWRRLTLARHGEQELIVGSLVDDTGRADPARGDLLRAAEARANPSRSGLPDDDVAALLAEFEIEADPIPEDGRDFDDAELRKKVAGNIWNARGKYQLNKNPEANMLLTQARKAWDSRNYVAHLDQGQMLALQGQSVAKQVTKRAVQLRPDDPEAWHWYAHALWWSSWEDAEGIISVIQPHLANQADALYDLACTRSLAGDLQVAADYLGRAYLAGYRDRAHIAADPDLRNLRESEYFSEVMQRFH
ncbi:MAG: sulfatase-like hydrolase/transferase [Acidobacteriota bacterium]